MAFFEGKRNGYVKDHCRSAISCPFKMALMLEVYAHLDYGWPKMVQPCWLGISGTGLQFLWDVSQSFIRNNIRVVEPFMAIA